MPGVSSGPLQIHSLVFPSLPSAPGLTCLSYMHRLLALWLLVRLGQWEWGEGNWQEIGGKEESEARRFNGWLGPISQGLRLAVPLT